MSRWGAGNLDSDVAIDFVESLLEIATKRIDAFLATPGGGMDEVDAIMACVAVHLALHNRLAVGGPDRGTAEALRAKVLEIFAREVDGLDANPAYKRDRRAVLDQTLASYVDAARGDDG